MRSILASIAIIFVLGSTIESVRAGSNGTQTVSSATPYTSQHAGTITPTCTIDVKDGELPTDQEFVTSLITIASNRGKISTICNSNTSGLVVTLAPGSAPPQPNYTEDFRLINGTGAYSGTSMTTYGTNYSKLDLANNYSNTASVLDVIARGKVLNGYYLAPGTYTIRVRATITP
jgi:hypothetical protein